MFTFCVTITYSMFMTQENSFNYNKQMNAIRIFIQMEN